MINVHAGSIVAGQERAQKRTWWGKREAEGGKGRERRMGGTTEKGKGRSAARNGEGGEEEG